MTTKKKTKQFSLPRWATWLIVGTLAAIGVGFLLTGCAALESWAGSDAKLAEGEHDWISGLLQSLGLSGAVSPWLAPFLYLLFPRGRKIVGATALDIGRAVQSLVKLKVADAAKSLTSATLAPVKLVGALREDDPQAAYAALQAKGIEEGWISVDSKTIREPS